MNRKLVIVGGGNGGPSTAFEAKRIDLDLDITIIESTGYVATST